MWRISPRRAVILIMFALVLAYMLQLLASSSGTDSLVVGEPKDAEYAARQLVNGPSWIASQKSHQMRPLSDDKLRILSSLSSQERFLQLLQPILIPRVSGTPGNLKVQQHIRNVLSNLGYTIELDSFEDQPPAPHARRTFTNIIATLNPRAPRRLVIACHFDSKFDSRGEFIGATDSAVPCAMMLDLATVLKGRIARDDVTLQLLFLDGEEAFGEWSATDSLYGARHLATKLSKSRNLFAPQVPTMTELNSIDVFVLLDLIGTQDTSFVNFNSGTAVVYNRLAFNEDKLAGLGLIARQGRTTTYFGRNQMPAGSFVDDDHRPFQEKGVPIVHLISFPFPSVWHKFSDNFANVHYPTVDDLNKILRAAVCEYLLCQI